MEKEFLKNNNSMPNECAGVFEGRGCCGIRDGWFRHLQAECGKL
jgi:hypothetical protein